MPLLEMILPRRDKINEHLLDDGSGVNIRAPWIDWRRAMISNWAVPLFLRNPKGYISNTGAQKILIGFIKLLEISCG